MFSLTNRRYFLLGFFLLIFGSLLTFLPQGISGQETTTYQDPEGKYQLELPKNWRAVSYQDGSGNTRVDIIYRDRAFGLLKVNQETIPTNTSLETHIQSEIDQNLRFRPGYVYNNIEPFSGGNLRGRLFEFDFTAAGQPKKGRNYYLTSSTQTLWVLRFTGNRKIFAPLRYESDAIARSFKLNQ